MIGIRWVIMGLSLNDNYIDYFLFLCFLICFKRVEIEILSIKELKEVEDVVKYMLING